MPLASSVDAASCASHSNEYLRSTTTSSAMISVLRGLRLPVCLESASLQQALVVHERHTTIGYTADFGEAASRVERSGAGVSIVGVESKRVCWPFVRDAHYLVDASAADALPLEIRPDRHVGDVQ